MKVAVACDHRGYEAKRRLLPVLKRLGHEVKDFGCDSPAACDYPDFAAPRRQGGGRESLRRGRDARRAAGSACRSSPTRSPGSRAALAHDEVTARRSREHNHCNVLCLGTDLLSEDQIRQIVEIFLGTAYVPGRHDRRVEKIKQLEREVAGAATVSPAPSSSAAGN
jgi:ribose 5-phosphate isomerase B